MTAAAKLLADALALPEIDREELAALLLDSIEPPPGISIEDEEEIRRRAQDARDGIYVVVASNIDVVAIAHAKRRPGYWRTRLP